MLHIVSKKVLGNNKGASVVFFVIVLTVITCVLALSLDMGVIVLEKSRLTSTADAAALAGAQALITDDRNVESITEEYIHKNSTDLKEIEISVDPDNRTVEVMIVKTVNNSFAKIFQKDKQDIAASAKASIGNIKSLGGARPLAVVQQDFVYGKLYTLKEGAGDGYSGNYGAIALGSKGGSTYRDNLLYGYPNVVSVGDEIETETGNMSGTTTTAINHLIQQCTHYPSCTYQSYNPKCPKIIFIPVVNTLEIHGRKFVKVLGFGTFFIEGVTSKSGSADVTGRFISYNMQGETSSGINDYGTYGIRLVK